MFDVLQEKHDIYEILSEKLRKCLSQVWQLKTVLFHVLKSSVCMHFSCYLSINVVKSCYRIREYLVWWRGLLMFIRSNGMGKLLNANLSLKPFLVSPISEPSYSKILQISSFCLFLQKFLNIKLFKHKLKVENWIIDARRRRCGRNTLWLNRSYMRLS